MLRRLSRLQPQQLAGGSRWAACAAAASLCRWRDQRVRAFRLQACSLHCTSVCRVGSNVCACEFFLTAVLLADTLPPSLLPAWLQCAPGADFRPMLAMVDRVMAARREMQAAAAKGAAAKPAAGQQRPGQPGSQQPQQKVSSCAQHAQRAGAPPCACWLKCSAGKQLHLVEGRGRASLAALQGCEVLWGIVG